MKTLVLDVHTPNNDGPDGSYTRLLVVPLTERLKERAQALARALTDLRSHEPQAVAITSQESHAHLIRPRRAEDAGLQQRLDDIAAAVHATGHATLHAPLTPQETGDLLDPIGGTHHMIVSSNRRGDIFVRWEGTLTTDDRQVLTWQTTPIELTTISQGATT